MNGRRKACGDMCATYLIHGWNRSTTGWVTNVVSFCLIGSSSLAGWRIMYDIDDDSFPTANNPNNPNNHLLYLKL